MVEQLDVRNTRLRSTVVLDFQRYFAQLPFNVLEVDALLRKWANRFSVDLATHIPPKIACVVGCLWTTFASDPDSKSRVCRQLNSLIIKNWLSQMCEVVNVSTGSVYQLAPEDR